MANDRETATAVVTRLNEHCELRPQLAERIHRELMMELHRRGIATIDEIHDLAREKLGSAPAERLGDPNQAERDRWDER